MNEPRLKLFVANLPTDWDERAVREYFQGHAAVAETQLFTEASESKANAGIGCAYVTFERKSEAEEVIRKLEQAKVLEARSLS